MHNWQLLTIFYPRKIPLIHTWAREKVSHLLTGSAGIWWILSFPVLNELQKLAWPSPCKIIVFKEILLCSCSVASAQAMRAHLSCSPVTRGHFSPAGDPVYKFSLAKRTSWLHSNIHHKSCKTAIYQGRLPRVLSSFWSAWEVWEGLTFSFFIEHHHHWWRYQNCIIWRELHLRVIFQTKHHQQAHCTFEKEHVEFSLQEMNLFPGVWSRYLVSTKRWSEVLGPVLYLEAAGATSHRNERLDFNRKIIFMTLK